MTNKKTCPSHGDAHEIATHIPLDRMKEWMRDFHGASWMEEKGEAWWLARWQCVPIEMAEKALQNATTD